MAKVLLGNIKGPKGDEGPQGEQGPAGPAGPTTIPTADFIGSEISRAESPAEQALLSKIVSEVVPATAPLDRRSRARNTMSFVTDSIGRGDSNPDTGLQRDAFPMYALAFSNGRLQLDVWSSVQGETVAQIFARTPAALVNKPGFLTVQGGTNDIREFVTGTRSAGTEAACIDQVFSTATGIPAIVAAALAVGTVPVLCTVPPRGFAGTSTETGPQQVKWRSLQKKINTKLRLYAAANNLPLVDVYSALVDPLTGAYKTAYALAAEVNGIHPGPTGHGVIGKALWDQLAPIVGPMSPPLLADVSDTTTLLPNPLFTQITTHTMGQMPTGWAQYLTSDPDVVLTMTDDPAGFGKRLRIANGPAGNLNGVKKGSIAFVAGHKYRLCGKYATDGGCRLQVSAYLNSANAFRFDQGAGTPVADGVFDLTFTPTVSINGEVDLVVYPDTSGWAEFWRVNLIDLTALGLA